MRAAAVLPLALAGGVLAAAALPPSVEAMLVPMAEAERRLQDAGLAHEAARREAAPAAEAVAQARARDGTWWGRWRLRRALGRLKEKLDRVEAARVERDEAREQVYLLLTAAEEELRAALEAGLARPGRGAELGAWWRRQRAWSLRLESLDAAPADREAVSGQGLERALAAQARVQQLERDLGLVKALRARGSLGAAEARADEAALRRALAAWRERAQVLSGF